MRQMGIGLVLIMIFALAATGSAQTAAIRPGDGIGAVKLGMTPAEVQAALGQAPTQRYANGWESWEPLKIDVYFYKGKAMLIDTEDPQMATAEGIRMGSTDVDLIKAYGVPICSGLNQFRGKAYLAWVYDGVFVFLNGSPRAAFGLRVVPNGLGKALCNG